MKRRLIMIVGVLGLSACGPGGGDAASSADTLTRRERDSIIATLPIPGAGGVGRALDASDRARERANALDSVR
jgi:hypothetical protein